MNRRHFLKTGSALGLAATTQSFSFFRQHSGQLAAAQLDAAEFLMPSTLPQVINIFLYGGASELAGNLTNIEAIDAASQNPYPESLLQRDGDNAQVTANGFWRDAGGDAMETMLASGDLSVYRTINRRKHNTRAHRQSIFSSQKGNLNIDGSPGMGATIAGILDANRHQVDGSAALGGRTLDDLILPFVSFEGSSIAFANDPTNPLALRLRGLSLDEQFENPYSRESNDNDLELRELRQRIVTEVQQTRFARVANGFALREQMEALIGNLQTAIDEPLPMLPASLDGTPDPDVDSETGRLRYPDNAFGARIRAAVTLALKNPDSLFISLGGGIGSWDDHDAALNEYVPRMQQLMGALRAATKHLRYSDSQYGGDRTTGNILINVHGDFGRNVNLNNSAGWDHGNNQNLYTLAGASLRPHGALGKIVGQTGIFGSAAENRLFTQPSEGSYEAEPMAIAASTYQYFGVHNPRALTMDALYNPDGDAAIDETVDGIELRS